MTVIRHFVEARVTQMAIAATAEGDKKSPEWRATVRAYNKHDVALSKRVRGWVCLWLEGYDIDLRAVALNGGPAPVLHHEPSCSPKSTERVSAEIIPVFGGPAPPGLEAVW